MTPLNSLLDHLGMILHRMVSIEVSAIVGLRGQFHARSLALHEQGRAPKYRDDFAVMEFVFQL